jgi:hypothetical protein
MASTVSGQVVENAGAAQEKKMQLPHSLHNLYLQND